MTPERMKEIEARCNSATPGPWYVVNFPSNRPEVCYASVRTNRDDQGTDVFGSENRGYKVGRVEHDGDHWQDISGQIDLAFAAHARTDIPDLLARVRELEAAMRGIYLMCLDAEQKNWPALAAIAKIKSESALAAKETNNEA